MFYDLSPNTYSWQVVDSNGCEEEGEITVNSAIRTSPSPPSLAHRYYTPIVLLIHAIAVSGTAEVVAPLCFGGVGYITVSGAGGVGNYSYSV